MRPNRQFPADLLTCIEEIHNGKRRFLYSFITKFLKHNAETYSESCEASKIEYLRKQFTAKRHWQDPEYVFVTTDFYK